MSFPIKTTLHDCGDEVYADMVHFVANAQAKRIGVPYTTREDRVQDCILYFLQHDLRGTYRNDMGTKFSTYVTTCVSRYLYRLLKVAAYKVFDLVEYARQKEEDAAETRAWEEVERLRAAYGDRVIDTLLAAMQRQISPHMAEYNAWSRGRIIQQMIQNIREGHGHEEETGTD